MPPRSDRSVPTSAQPDAELVVERVLVEQPDEQSVEFDGASPDGAATPERLSTVDVTVARVATTTPRSARVPMAAGIDIRWTDDGACVVELRGRPTRAMLAKTRDLLWSRSPHDRLTVVVSDAVLTRELFAMLVAGRRRLSSSGVFEIVGLDAPGARRIARDMRPSHG